MPGKTDAAALLEAQQHPALEHFTGDIFEADRGLDQLEPVRRAHLVHHRRRGQRFHNPAPALSVHDKMMQQQTNELMRRERVPAAVHSPYPVGVPVGDEADVVRMFLQKRGGGAVVFRDRFRIEAAEEGIVFRVQRGHLATRACEQFIETTRADAEERVVRKAQP